MSAPSPHALYNELHIILNRVWASTKMLDATFAAETDPETLYDALLDEIGDIRAWFRAEAREICGDREGIMADAIAYEVAAHDLTPLRAEVVAAKRAYLIAHDQPAARRMIDAGPRDARYVTPMGQVIKAELAEAA